MNEFIANLPIKLKLLLLAHQQRAGNIQNLSVFISQPLAGTYEGGFNWENTPEGYDFWNNLLINNIIPVEYSLENEEKEEIKEEVQTLVTKENYIKAIYNEV
jgi:hypothetical protein